MLTLTIDKINAAISKTNGNKEQAAVLLGISAPTLFRRLREYRETGVISPIKVKPSKPPAPVRKAVSKGAVSVGTDWHSLVGHDFMVVSANNLDWLVGRKVRVQPENVWDDPTYLSKAKYNIVLTKEVLPGGRLAEQGYYLSYDCLEYA